MQPTELPSIPNDFTRTVAERSFVLRDRTGEIPVRVELGEPRQDVAVVDETDWRCPLRITIGIDVTVQSLVGIDSLQSLLLAISLARAELETIATRPDATLAYLGQEIDTSQPNWQSNLF